MGSNYPPQASLVSVFFNDGEVKTFRITASNGIASHLMKEAADSGFLVMRDDDTKKSICIAIGQVRYVEMQTVDYSSVIEK